MSFLHLVGAKPLHCPPPPSPTPGGRDGGVSTHLGAGMGGMGTHLRLVGEMDELTGLQGLDYQACRRGSFSYTS